METFRMEQVPYQPFVYCFYVKLKLNEILQSICCDELTVFS